MPSGREGLDHDGSRRSGGEQDQEESPDRGPVATQHEQHLDRGLGAPVNEWGFPQSEVSAKSNLCAKCAAADGRMRAGTDAIGSERPDRWGPWAWRHRGATRGIRSRARPGSRRRCRRRRPRRAATRRGRRCGGRRDRPHNARVWCAPFQSGSAMIASSTRRPIGLDAIAVNAVEGHCALGQEAERSTERDRQQIAGQQQRADHDAAAEEQPDDRFEAEQQRLHGQTPPSTTSSTIVMPIHAP